jgi:hypothetical protein
MIVDVKPLGGSANETTAAFHRRLFPNSFLESTSRVRRRVEDGGPWCRIDLSKKQF